MTNIDNETQPESSNNVTGNTQFTCMIDGKTMKIIMKNFKYWTKEIGKHSNIMNKHIKEVKKLHDMFRKFVKDSLDFNNRLKNYAVKVSSIKKCLNGNCSNEGILVLLNDLLKESNDNYILAKELEKRLFVDGGVGFDEEDGIMKFFKKLVNSIFGYGESDDKKCGGIMNELIKIQNSLPGYIEDFENEIASNEKALISYEGDTRYIIYFFVVSNLARLTKMKVFEEAKKDAEKWLDEEKKVIKNQLSGKKNELKMINLFNDNLRTIILGISDIKTFWGEQIESIKNIITNLKNFESQKDQNIQQSLTVHILKKNWEDIERKCQSYNKVMNNVLYNDYLD
ncbi:uncharacterized protein OCT59_004891 [Rhizophagus irregularis]|uniref:Uncharacterized protein n=2 Tax=Rhizophagus irregularis TaxID=588596 RepID=A0A015I0C1_RHIIW|nr:hypothetical protein RirG_271500 [Rhizophagus irregularis DAOM 197198w]UZO13392.1 hypothetical protein OCT59_004891 [Rhizophagus irregularis]GET53411.1 hypothetical protein GLOIN_2v1511683 [Rhizophagus irregularis DAOM 181602=DAOM 197198]